MDLELTIPGCDFETQRDDFELHSPSRGHERPYLCFLRHFKNRGLGTLNRGLGSFQTVAVLRSTLAGVGRLIVRVFPFLAVHLSTWLRSIRLAVSSSWMGGDCKMPKGISDGATKDERMLQGCMQLSGVVTFYPRDDSQRVENPLIDGCQLSSFECLLLQLCPRHRTSPLSCACRSHGIRLL